MLASRTDWVGEKRWQAKGGRHEGEEKWGLGVAGWAGGASGAMRAWGAGRVTWRGRRGHDDWRSLPGAQLSLLDSCPRLPFLRPALVDFDRLCDWRNRETAKVELCA